MRGWRSWRASSFFAGDPQVSSEVMTSAATFLPAKVTPLASGDRHDDVNLGLSAKPRRREQDEISPRPQLPAHQNLLHGQIDPVRSIFTDSRRRTQVRSRALVQEQAQSATPAGRDAVEQPLAGFGRSPCRIEKCDGADQAVCGERRPGTRPPRRPAARRGNGPRYSRARTAIGVHAGRRQVEVGRGPPNMESPYVQRRAGSGCRAIAACRYALRVHELPSGGAAKQAVDHPAIVRRHQHARSAIDRVVAGVSHQVRAEPARGLPIAGRPCSAL